MDDVFKNKHNLEAWLDSEDSEEYRDTNFFELFEISESELTGAPYWLDEYYDHDTVFVQYRSGYYEPRKIGDILNIDGAQYEYIDSQLLSEEMEHQAHDGGLAYEYRGSSFIRILKKLD
jgi:hypothetical protein